MGLTVQKSTIADGKCEKKTGIVSTLLSDLRAVPERDPAVRPGLFGWLEIVLCYQGLHALWAHRAAHFLWQRGLKLLARMLNRFTQFSTGVDIHPGAVIGSGMFIDHATGVVIGETSVIGNDVTLFQGVTLGGTGKAKGKRHPTVGDGAVVGAGAKVLGDITIGAGSLIGGGSVVLNDVPDNSTVVGVPARLVVQDGKRVDELAHNQISDPVLEMLEQMQLEIDELKGQLAGLHDERSGD